MFIDLLRSRRSVRKFENRPVERGKLDILVESMLRSPSSANRAPWAFIVVTDAQKLLQLSKAKTSGSSFLRDAPLAIVVCADSERSDVWVEDASIASLIVHLAATDLGLGSCWVQIRLREHDREQSAQDYVAEVLGLREGTVVESIVAIGYPAERKPGHPESSLSYDKVSFDEYGQRR
jgi:nitroreductase